MKVVRMTLDEKLVAAVDQCARQLGITRSAFVSEALAKCRIRELEARHRAGYKKHPVKHDEFVPIEPERQWGDAWT